MKYIFKDGTEYYDCVQADNGLTLSPDKQIIRATLKPEKGTVDIAS